jgi:hypothetical protein
MLTYLSHSSNERKREREKERKKERKKEKDTFKSPCPVDECTFLGPWFRRRSAKTVSLVSYK